MREEYDGVSTVLYQILRKYSSNFLAMISICNKYTQELLLHDIAKTSVKAKVIHPVHREQCTEAY